MGRNHGEKNLLPLLQLAVAIVKEEEEIYDCVKQFLWILVCDVVLSNTAMCQVFISIGKLTVVTSRSNGMTYKK